MTEWDDVNRIYTDPETGESRPYTPAEDDEADQRIRAADPIEINAARIALRLETSVNRLSTAIEELRAIGSKTNAEITAKDTKDVARASRVLGIEVRRLVRHITRQLGTIENDE